MSVIINGFNMPDTCEKCLFARWSNVNQTSSCVLVPPGKVCFEMYSVEYRSKRSDICPLTTIYPEPPKGKWIYHPDWEADGECAYECDQCGMGSDVDYNFCMRCGARMEGNDGND